MQTGQKRFLVEIKTQTTNWLRIPAGSVLFLVECADGYRNMYSSIRWRASAKVCSFTRWIHSDLRIEKIFLAKTLLYGLLMVTNQLLIGKICTLFWPIEETSVTTQYMHHNTTNFIYSIITSMIFSVNVCMVKKVYFPDRTNRSYRYDSLWVAGFWRKTKLLERCCMIFQSLE